MRLGKLGLALGLSLLAGASTAADRKAVFDVSSTGFNIGTLQLVANENGPDYSARLVMDGGGLVGVFVKFAFDGSSQGRVNGEGLPSPVAYDGTRVLRDDDRRTRMRFDGGRIASRDINPPKKKRKWDVDPSTLSGMMDPVSAAYALLTDQPTDRACDRNLEVFDGTRHFRIAIGARKKNGKGWRCDGTYRRVAGYSPNQMKKQKSFAFSLFYDTAGEAMRLREFRTDSIVGNAVARRR